MKTVDSQLEKKVYVRQVQSPVGPLRLYATETELIGVYMQQEKSGPLNKHLSLALPHRVPSPAPHSVDILTQTEQELAQYFAGKLKKFTVPLGLTGSAFQKSVWLELLKIPLGHLRTYGEHARSIAKITAVRAVSSAIGSNPIGIIIPCHRVIGKNRTLTGYAGGLKVKSWLLSHEGHNIENECVTECRGLQLSL